MLGSNNIVIIFLVSTNVEKTVHFRVLNTFLRLGVNKEFQQIKFLLLLSTIINFLVIFWAMKLAFFPLVI